MNILQRFLVLVQIIVVGFWPIWLSLLFVFGLLYTINISTLQNLHGTQKKAMYISVVLLAALFSFIWVNSLLANVRMLLAHISFNEVVYTEEITIPRKRIHQELLLRMILPPMERECFSPNEICDWLDGLLDIQEGGRGSYTMTQRWLGYVLRFLVFGLPFGLGMAWLLNRLIKYRLRRQAASPT